MKTESTTKRLTTAIHSLEEYLQGVWEGEEGLQVIIDSLRIVEQDHAVRIARDKQVGEPTSEELLAIVRAYGAALDMSDSEHPDFCDSGADVVEYLWLFEGPVRQVLGKLAARQDPAAPR